MSTTTTSSAAAATTTAKSCINVYNTPVDDIACAVPFTEDNVDHMSKCCKEADVISYYDDCGLYCLALGQSADDLTQCLYDEGLKYSEVFCRDNGTASATATGGGKLMPSASVVAESDEKKEKDDDKEKEENKEEDDDDSAGAIARPQGHTTVVGVVIGTLLFSATAFGAALI